MDANPIVHPTDQTLSAYGLGHLDERSAQSVQQHLGSCSDCRRRVAELSSDRSVGGLHQGRDRHGTSSHGLPVDRSLGRSQAPKGEQEKSDAGWSRFVAIGGDRGPAGLAPPSPHTLPPGLAEHPVYEVIGELGRGGMGIVYLARNKLMGRNEVLKIVNRELVNDPDVLERFLREIRNAGRLLHANIVTAYSATRVGDSVVLAMEYVDGYDLAKLVEAQGPLPVPLACNLICQVTLGLQFAHEKSMVHRDIKPSNLILSRQGNRPSVKVLDFGLAKATREAPMEATLTQQGQMLGTPHYIAPEQSIDAQKADIRADIYSLGCTLYHLLSGAPPFRGTSLYEILQAHHSMNAKPLNLVRTDVPKELAEVVGKMMAKEPERRFQTPKEAGQALKQFYKSANSQTSRPIAEQTERKATVSNEPDDKSVPPPVHSDTYVVAEPPDSAKQIQSLRPRPLTEKPRGTSSTTRSQYARLRAILAACRPWAWQSGAVAGFLLGLMLAWSAIAPKPKDASVVLVGLPSESAVFVDDERTPVRFPGGGKSAEIPVRPGIRKIEVRRDGFQPQLANVPVQPGGRFALPVRLIPLARPAVGVTTPPRNGWAGTGNRQGNAQKQPSPSTFSSTTAGTTEKAPASNMRLNPSKDLGGLMLPVVGKTYRIINVKSSKTVDVQSSSYQDTAPIIQAEISPRRSQLWSIVQEKSDFLIKNYQSGCVIDIPYGKLTNGLPLQQYRYVNGSANQLWDFRQKENGIAIVARNGLVMAVPGSGSDRSRVVQAAPRGSENELWRFVEVDDASEWTLPSATQPNAVGERASGGSAETVEELLAAGDSPRGGAVWCYSTSTPPTRWAEHDFDDSSWRRGQAAFGARDMGLIPVKTHWDTHSIWARVRFTVPKLGADSTFVLHVFHDEDVRIFVNGRQLYEANGFDTKYRDVQLDPKSYSAFRPGEENVMAVSCRDTLGSRGVDVGLTLYTRKKTSPMNAKSPTSTESPSSVSSFQKKPEQPPAGKDASSEHVSVRTADQALPDSGTRSSQTSSLKPTTNSIGMTMVHIPAGEFDMGASQSDNHAEYDERPQHRVKLSRDFYLGATEVTQGEYKAVMQGKNPSEFAFSDSHPVHNVSWLDAIVFCNALSRKEKLPEFYKVDAENAEVRNWDGTGYRLPTEAEWEYACRANTATRYWFGDNPDELTRHAWVGHDQYLRASGGNSHDRPQKVREPGHDNAFGLFDMSGNVAEWCWDWEAIGAHYEKSPQTTVDPIGPHKPDEYRSHRVRGGHAASGPWRLRSSARDYGIRSHADKWFGFRVARNRTPD